MPGGPEYIDPPDYPSYVDYLDPRQDPTSRTNPDAFWIGYGKFREGRNYLELPPTRNLLAGWFYGLREGREASKSLWASKHTYHGLVTIGLCVFGYLNWDAVVQNPDVAVTIGSIMGALEIYIRRITRVTIR